MGTGERMGMVMDGFGVLVSDRDPSRCPFWGTFVGDPRVDQSTSSDTAAVPR